MKILWLSHLIPYPPKGGVLQRSYQLVTELSRKHEVDLLAFNQRELIAPLFKNYDEGLAEANKVLLEMCRTVRFINMECDNTRYGKPLLALRSMFSHDPYTINWCKSHDYSIAARKLANENTYDLVHFDTISLLPYFSLFPDTPRVLDHHNIESQVLLRRAKIEKNVIKKWYYLQEGYRLQQVEKRFCPKFDLNITCSTTDSERLAEIAPGAKSTDIPNGVDVDYFTPRKTTTIPKRLIFVGSLGWYPNADAVTFIAQKLWGDLSDAIPGISIDIIGSNPPPAALEAAQRFPGFFVHGFVDDIRPFLDRAELYLCPIRDGGGTKLKLLDAFSMGKTVVAHPVACEGIDAVPDKHVVLATSPKEFIEKIGYLLNNKIEREAIGLKARELAERRYSYNAIGEKLCEVFAQCAK
jgi:glycosyltransferase involved in cell wall biosynthesis